MNLDLSRSKSAILALSAVAVFGLSACDKNDTAAMSQKVDNAVAKTEEKAKELGRDAKDATANASANVKEAVSDASITAAVSTGIVKDSELSATRINVDTKDGVVTLTGPVPSNSAREKAETIAKGTSGVSSVKNQLTVVAS